VLSLSKHVLMMTAAALTAGTFSGTHRRTAMPTHPATPRFTRVDSFGIVAFAYLVALAVALWVWSLTSSWGPLWSVAAADVAATFVIFGFSIKLDNGSMYDPYWSVVPPLIALAWIAGAESTVSTTRQVVVTTLVFAWGIRLTYNWARGWPGLHHEDWRYLDLYSQAPKWLISLLGIHLFPTVIVLLGCLGLLPALSFGDNPWNWLDSVALLVTGGAILIETVADEQMRVFARNKRPGDIMTTGLWAWSRHPNYFGELSFWCGLFLFGLAAAPGFWWSLIGPLAIAAMFRFASIPMLDERSKQRRPGYAAYMAETNAIIPGRRRTGNP